jgi:PIN domain nuclease of toxin-antitoxin system
MKILLDTHTFLWFVTDDPKLGQQARAAIATADIVCVSAISVVEVIIKQMLGRLPQGIDVPSVALESGFVLLSYDASHAASLAKLPTLARHDPFDRMLAGQALADNLTMVTTDSVLLELNQFETLNTAK